MQGLFSQFICNVVLLTAVPVVISMLHSIYILYIKMIFYFISPSILALVFYMLCYMLTDSYGCRRRNPCSLFSAHCCHSRHVGRRRNFPKYFNLDSNRIILWEDLEIINLSHCAHGFFCGFFRFQE